MPVKLRIPAAEAPVKSYFTDERILVMIIASDNLGVLTENVCTGFPLPLTAQELKDNWRRVFPTGTAPVTPKLTASDFEAY